ncbi:alpha-amylase/4-alpha-glucanotransferase domain-containing protein [Dechloromonas hortensis]|uniref:alpha-amylase/4-alpha-glucanotransferase domain-containing protein n=1 Tax=Dechloromonas hortensis TaxID=337779 RepID=UPI001291C727
MSPLPTFAAACSDGRLGRHLLYDGDIFGGFARAQALSDSQVLVLEDGLRDGRSRLRMSIPVKTEGRPQQTVSQSAAGFEKIMLGIRIMEAIAA